MDIWSVSTKHKGTLYKLSFEALGSGPETVEFVIRVVENQNARKLPLYVNASRKHIRFPNNKINLAGLSPLVRCLIACLVGVAIDIIGKCLSTSSNAEDFLNCLSINGVGVAGDAMKCILGCFTSDA